jgi:hypothetical protein
MRGKPPDPECACELIEGTLVGGVSLVGRVEVSVGIELKQPDGHPAVVPSLDQSSRGKDITTLVFEMLDCVFDLRDIVGRLGDRTALLVDIDQCVV